MFTGRQGSTILQGTDFVGRFEGREVAIEKTGKDGGYISNMTAEDIIRIFAYAMQNNIETLSKEQADKIIKEGFIPQTEMLKEFHIIQEGASTKNKIYSTEK